MDISKIGSPTLILNKEICIQNIDRMIQKTKASEVNFRPHFKTHQSIKIGEWFRNRGVNKITVSSVKMAEYFANAGWDDILISFPFNINEFEKIESLQKRINLCVLASNLQICKILSQQITFKLEVYLEIDVGYPRSGFHYLQSEEIKKAVEALSQNPNIVFKGFVSHFGNSYSEKANNIEDLWNNSVNRLNEIKQKFKHLEYIQISVGDTPCCTIVNDFNSVDEIRPGNFVFYDVMQLSNGICKFEDIALCVYCPVVDIHPERNEFIIYGGAVHLSKEYILIDNGDKNYGLICTVHDKKWSAPVVDTFIKSLSQEHGIVHSTTSFIDSLRIGDIVGVLPVHSCLTADCLKKYYTTEGEILDHM